MRPFFPALALALAVAAGCAPALTEPPATAPARPVAAAPASSGRATILGADASPITFERMARFPEPGWDMPRSAQFSPDGKMVTFLASEKGGAEMALYAFDLQTKETRTLVKAADLLAQTGPMSREEELRRERQRQREQGITSYRWAKRKNRILIPLGGDLFLRDESEKLVRLTDTKEPEIDGKLCATGERAAYVRENELYVMDVATRREVALTRGSKEGQSHGLSDYNGQEEFDEESGFFFSPTCDRLVYLEVDERLVATTPILGYRGNKPDLMQERYPEAGAKNPIVKVGILDLATKRSTWVKWPDAAENYYGRVSWSADGKWFLAQRLARNQKKVEIVRVEASSGETKVLFAATHPAWVTFLETRLLEKAPSMVVLRDLDGHDHLEVRDARTGQATVRLTSGDWDVTAIVGVDEERGRVVFEATKDGVIDRQLYAVALTGGAIARLGSEPGVHKAIANATASAFVDVHSAADRLPAAVIRDANGNAIGELPRRRDADLDRLGIRPPRFVTVNSHGVPLQGALLEPRNRKEGVKYPVIVMVYGGPDIQFVLNRYTPHLQWQHLADRGFVVFQLDNRGSAGRGHAFETPIARHLGEVELEDQLAGVAYLKTLPFVDGDRIGIYGHSYGGFMAVTAMLRAPEQFKVGVAGSPVTDWRFYDTGYTERFMGTPADNKEGYDASDPASLAKRLQGRLLVIHALMDENVHFANSAHLFDALVAADKHFDVFVFPGERHGYRDPAARAYAFHYVVDYFVEHL
jgi:dipeptidyl-peptidase 4